MNMAALMAMLRAAGKFPKVTRALADDAGKMARVHVPEGYFVGILGRGKEHLAEPGGQELAEILSSKANVNATRTDVTPWALRRKGNKLRLPTKFQPSFRNYNPGDKFYPDMAERFGRGIPTEPATLEERDQFFALVESLFRTLE